VDVIKDEADEDYQLAAGISQDVEADDSILNIQKRACRVSFSVTRRFYFGASVCLKAALLTRKFFFYAIDCNGRKC
jgi:hypothetical protein